MSSAALVAARMRIAMRRSYLLAFATAALSVGNAAGIILNIGVLPHPASLFILVATIAIALAAGFNGFVYRVALSGRTSEAKALILRATRIIPNTQVLSLIEAYEAERGRVR